MHFHCGLLSWSTPLDTNVPVPLKKSLKVVYPLSSVNLAYNDAPTVSVVYFLRAKKLC